MAHKKWNIIYMYMLRVDRAIAPFGDD